MIAALFVASGGAYFEIDGVDPWDEARDAREYAGPHPVVAHPPCERWGRYWHGGPSAKARRVKGDDAGCFASALASVRQWGGRARASGGERRMGALRPHEAAEVRRMDRRGHPRRMDVLRGARSLRAPREKGDVALRVRHDVAPFASVGTRDLRSAARRWLPLGRGAASAQRGRHPRRSAAAHDAREPRHASRFPRCADRHCANGARSRGSVIDIQQPDGGWRKGTYRGLVAAEDEHCRQTGAPTAAERMARETAEKEQRDATT